MKTTIDFPEDLLHRAKVVAAQRQTTLREMVVQGRITPRDTGIPTTSTICE